MHQPAARPPRARGHTLIIAAGATGPAALRFSERTQLLREEALRLYIQLHTRTYVKNIINTHTFSFIH